MLLLADDGTRFELTPTAYQFADAEVPASGAPDWDTNWLLISGRLTWPDGRTLAFTDPCLTTWEARDLGRWLADAAAGMELPAVHDGCPGIGFTEPVLAFLLVHRNDRDLALRPYLRLEPGPTAPAEERAGHEHRVVLTMPPSRLRDAAAAWQRELDGFPLRGAAHR